MGEQENGQATPAPANTNPFQIVPSEIQTNVKISVDTMSVILIIVGAVIATTTIFLIKKSF